MTINNAYVLDSAGLNCLLRISRQCGIKRVGIRAPGSPAVSYIEFMGVSL